MNKRVEIIATKLNAEQGKIPELEAIDSGYFRDEIQFDDDGTQGYLVFQSIYRYFKKIDNTYHIHHISAWKSKGCLMKVLMLLQHLIIALLQH